MPPDTPVERGLTHGALAEERYRPLFALSPQPAWVYDRETLRFLEVNEAATLSYGWSRAEFLAMTIRDIRPPDAQPGLNQQLVDAESVDRNAVRSVHRTRSGQLRNVVIYSYPLEFDGRA